MARIESVELDELGRLRAIAAAGRAWLDACRRFQEYRPHEWDPADYDWDELDRRRVAKVEAQRRLEQAIAGLPVEQESAHG